jgi:hypothetical protein
MRSYDDFISDDGGENIQPPTWGASHSRSLDSDPPTWGPSHSVDTEEDGATASSRNEETWITFLSNIFQCGGMDLPPEELEELELEIEEDPFFGLAAGGGCTSPFLSNKKKAKRSSSQRSSEEDTTTRRADSNGSLADVLPTRAWSSPARLNHGKSGVLIDECGFTYLSNDKRNRVLDDTFYFSDMDTFLSDEFTVMEQGYFNHLYDQLCKPIQVRRKQGVGRQEAPNAVLLSFDDTISKLTQEDGQKSLSTMSLNTLEHIKKGTVDNATIAAIVKAQANGGWKSRVQEEAEAKADDLSQFGVEHTFTELDIPPAEPKKSAEPGNVIYVHYQAESKDDNDDDDIRRQESEEPRTNFPSENDCTPESSANSVDKLQEEEEAEVEETKPSRHFAKKFLKNPFRRNKKKEKMKQTAAWGVKTPPRVPKQGPLHHPSPTTSGTGPCSVSAESDKPEITIKVDVLPTSAERQGPPMTRKEPIYTPFIQTLSEKEFVQNVEILRQGSALSNNNNSSPSSPLGTTNHDRDGFGESHDTPTTEKVSDFPCWILKENERRLDVPDLDELLDDEYTSSCSSMELVSLATMTSRLKEEREETERLRKLLEEKDEDLVRLKELLRVNESAAVLERVNSEANSVQGF